MTGQRHNRMDWFDAFPVEDILFQASQKSNDEILLIDIAGGRGHDLEAFRRRFPNASGKLILQEVPDVINDIQNLDESIVRMEYDFFTPQPVLGKWTLACYFCIVGSLTHMPSRRSSILLPRHIPQLARPQMPRYPSKRRQGDEARVFQTSNQRMGSIRSWCSPLPRSFRHQHDGYVIGNATNSDAVEEPT